MTEAELAYAAGIIDGEGSFYIHERPPYRSSVSPSHTLSVSVSNTDRRMLDWMHERFGGTILVNKPPTNRAWSQAYQWRVSSRLAVTFIDQIYPYLVCKREQADIAVEFAAIKHTGYPLSAEVIEARRGCRERMLRGR